MNVVVRDAGEADRAYISRRLTESWGSARVVAHGVVYDPVGLPALIADVDSSPAGILTYAPGADAWEIVTLDSFLEGVGVGSALMAGVETRASAAGVAHLWLITTNDNTHALRFYQRRGYDLVALHRNALARSRELKPSIPLEVDGIPLRHELELEKRW